MFCVMKTIVGKPGTTDGKGNLHIRLTVPKLTGISIAKLLLKKKIYFFKKHLLKR